MAELRLLLLKSDLECLAELGSVCDHVPDYVADVLDVCLEPCCYCVWLF